jgi:two-component system, NarL family, nitrate/nitrite response regulator NarP
MKTGPEITVLIIDEHPTVSQMLARSLRRIPGIRVVGETSNVMLGAELAHELVPDVILADFRRTGPPRRETYRWLARVSPASRLIAHTSYLSDGDERALREAGVSGCVLKGTPVSELASQLLHAAVKRPRRRVPA